MRSFFRLRYAKTAALAAAACFYFPFVAGRSEPGPGFDQASAILDGTVGLTHPVVWDALVRLVGRDVALLGTVSMVAAFACTLLVSFFAGDLIALSLRAMRRRVGISDEAVSWIRRRAEFLTALAFVLTPGFFHAATHVGPLHVLLIPLLAGLALLLRILAAVEEPLYDRLKKDRAKVLLGLALLGCAWFEMSLSTDILRAERMSFLLFGAIGVFPLAVLAHLTRRHVLLARTSYVRFFSVWTLVAVVAGIVAIGQTELVAGGSLGATAGGVLGRTLLSLVLIAATYAIESTAMRTRARHARQERMIVSRCRERMEAAFREAERERRACARTAQAETPARAAVPATRSYHQLTEEEREARKIWARARLMKHSRNPDWKKNGAYLGLVLEAAQGGCAEAMNKLSEYAVRRHAYVEAYYWALKVELAEARCTGQSPAALLKLWLRHKSSTGHHRFHDGFSDDEYHFARAVLRVRSGVDRDKGLKRLRRLLEDEFEDAELFVQKNGLEKELGLAAELA